MCIVQKFRNLYYICLFYSLLLFVLKFIIQEKMKEMEQENIPKGGTPLSAREIVKINVGNNFRGFGFRPTQPSPLTTSKESLVETELRGIVDIQMKELESTRKELDSTRAELSNTCDELKKCQTELNDTRSELGKHQEHMKNEKDRLDRIEKYLFPINVSRLTT